MENIEALLRRCYETASHSPDRSNQCGALLYHPGVGGVIGEGCNKFPNKVVVTPELINDRERKLFYIEHAERNSIYDAIASGNGDLIPGSIMICPWFACADCARAILLSGIKRVIGHQERMAKTPDRWKASVDAGLDLLRLHDVQLEFYGGMLNSKPILVNTELISL